jgi:hypothetical protein
VLSRFDEYLIHQTPEPLAHPASLDRNLYDRYWLGGFATDASLYFAVSLGVYPNRQVMDAAMSVLVDGEQVCRYASRRAQPGAREATRVGPLSIEVLEPMRALRVALADGDGGLAADLTFRARSACVEEDRQVLRRGREPWMDVTRFTQFGRWDGELRLDGRRIAVDGARVAGIRDRSWGRRNVGEPEAGAPPQPPQVHFTWAPLLWDDHATLAVFFDDAQGRALHAEARRVPLYARPDAAPDLDDPGVARFHGAARRLRYAPGTRRVADATLALMDGDGSVLEAALEPLACFQMKGTGYGHPAWRHGTWKGELATGADRWRVEALDPLAVENLHVQQLVRCRAGTRTGIGVLEHVCVGPHAPSGFAGLADGARG